MQRTVFSKVLSLLLAMLLSLVAFAAVQIITPKAYAEKVGLYEINFATAGNTATANGITANATIMTGSISSINGRDMVHVDLLFTGNATDAGVMTLELSGNSAKKGPFNAVREFYVPQGLSANNGIGLRGISLNVSDLGNISDLTLSLSCNISIIWYELTPPATKTVNGITAKVYMGISESAFKDAGTKLYPWVDITGNPTTEGSYTFTLSSIKANYSSTVTSVVYPAGSPVIDYCDFLQDFIMPAEAVDDFIFNVTFTPSINSNSSSSSGGGGNSSYSPPSIPAPASVNTASAVKYVKNAVEAAKDSLSGAHVKLKNVSIISLSTMKEMVKAAGNTPLKVSADSLAPDSSVDVRITFDPSQAKNNIDLSASTTSLDAKITQMKFAKYFNNSLSVVSLSQKGNFGMPVTVAAKIDKKLNTETLVFYSYDSKTNTYTKIENPQYKVDKNGYVHFTTSIGGEIIISDKPLAKK